MSTRNLSMWYVFKMNIKNRKTLNCCNLVAIQHANVNFQNICLLMFTCFTKALHTIYTMTNVGIPEKEDKSLQKCPLVNVVNQLRCRGEFH